MQSQYDILKCLSYMENLLSVPHIKANYEKSLYRWYDEVGQTIMSGVKVCEKENHIKIKDIAIELMEVKQFKDGHIIINSLKDDSSQVSVKTITKK